MTHNSSYPAVRRRSIFGVDRVVRFIIFIYPNARSNIQIIVSASPQDFLSMALTTLFAYISFLNLVSSFLSGISPAPSIIVQAKADQARPSTIASVNA